MQDIENIGSGNITVLPDVLGETSQKRKLEEDDLKTEQEPKKKKPFRKAAKGFSITYSQCDIPKQDFMEYFKKQGCIYVLVAQEHHEIEGVHCHLHVKFAKTKNIKNERIWDLPNTNPEKDPFHPNIQATKDSLAWSTYCKKEDSEYLQWAKECEPRDFDLGSKKNMMEDQDYERKYYKWKEMQELEFPVQLRNISIEHPDPKVKQRHIWIKGKPDIGKTYMIETTFENKKVFQRSDNLYPYEDYQDEKIIIYDDILPSWKELAAATGTYYTRHRMPGGCRYKAKYWTEYQSRTLIILNNLAIEQVYGNNREIYEAVKARFKEYIAEDDGTFTQI